jgi:hypothetical protein
MHLTRKNLLLALLAGVIAMALALQFIGKPVFVTWLRAHSTVRMLLASPDGRYNITVYRYPRLADVPEVLGFGQGYVQLYEVRSSPRVLNEQVAEDLAAIHRFTWMPSSVEIVGFAEWKLPSQYQARN